MEFNIMEFNTLSVLALIIVGVLCVGMLFFLSGIVVQYAAAPSTRGGGAVTLPPPSTEDNPDTFPHPYSVGENYFIRTVTFHFTGKLIEVYPEELVLLEASWIADSGRYADALKSGNFSEVEPYPEGRKVVVGRGAIVDASIQDTPLPRKQQ